MKAHIGVDKDNGLTHAIETTATKIHDPAPLQISCTDWRQR